MQAEGRHTGPATTTAPLGQTPCSLLRQQAGSQGSCPPLLSNLRSPPEAGPPPRALHVPTADKAEPGSCRGPGLSGQLEGRHFRLLPRQEVAQAGPAHTPPTPPVCLASSAPAPPPSPSPPPPPPGSRPACFLAIETDTTLSPALEAARVDGGAAQPRGCSELARWPPLLPG